MKNNSINRKTFCKKRALKSHKMRIKKMCSSFFVLFVFIIPSIMAQEAIVSSGGDGSGSGGSVAYSVGQIVFSTNSNATGSEVQGVQQPYEISVITGVEQTSIRLDIEAYPNPVAEKLVLKFSKDLSIKPPYYYAIYDINGRLVLKKEIKEHNTNIEMGNLSQATYFLKIIRNNKEFKSFKIIKK